MSDFEKLEEFFKFLSDKESKINNTKNQINNSTSIFDANKLMKTYFDHLNKFKYFYFIPKDNTKISQANLNLAIELKSMSKYYYYQSYILGANILYIMLITNPKKYVLSFYSLLSLGVASGVTNWYQ
jgi:hypothetical protein